MLIVAASAVALVAIACADGDDDDSLAPTPTANETQLVATTTVADMACTAPLAATDREAAFAQILRDDIDRVDNAPAEYLAVRQPSAGIAYAAGVSSEGEELEARAPFRIASNSKTFTAAAILRLSEQGKLGLDDAIAMHISPEAAAILVEDGYDPETITVRQMLHHVSGLYDYATDPSYVTTAVSDQQKRWTRLEQVQFAMDNGDPLGEPGTVHVYSDTGYVLLGEILERTTGLSLAEAYRELLRFEELGLRDTYLESLEDVPPGTPDRSQQLFGELNGRDWDPSYDLYGGGGFVSTVEDLSRFYCALFSGGIFDDPATIEIMTSPPADMNAQADYGNGIAMGLFEYSFEEMQCWGHIGFWGSSAFYCPELGLTMAMTLNQASLPESYVFGRANAAIIAELLR